MVVVVVVVVVIGCDGCCPCQHDGSVEDGHVVVVGDDDD